MRQYTYQLSMSQGQQVFIETAHHFLQCDTLDAIRPQRHPQGRNLGLEYNLYWRHSFSVRDRIYSAWDFSTISTPILKNRTSVVCFCLDAFECYYHIAYIPNQTELEVIAIF